MKYLIVLFKNKKRKKILNKFKTLERADKYFNDTLKTSNNVLFSKSFENGKPCKYEIGFLESGSTDFNLYFVKDELGRQIKVDIDDPDYRLTKIVDYNIEELLYDVNKKNKISFGGFIKKYLTRSGIKLISKLNNKVAIQNDDEVNLVSLKSIDECSRFIDVLEDYLIKNGRLDCILVKDTSKQQKKYLYTILESKGINKSFLYRRFTTFTRE
jgi:hypothetical protein